MSYRWRKVDDETPEGQILETCVIQGSDIRMQQRLIKKKNLWWHTDMSMYVYYIPTHYRLV